jgi:hypothetical protein
VSKLFGVTKGIHGDFGWKQTINTSSVVDPHHVDADPDPTFHPDAGPEADPDFDFLFDAYPYPDPTFHPDADLGPDPDPSFKKKDRTVKKILK